MDLRVKTGAEAIRALVMQ
ncbi:hypothetical protein ACSOV0_005273, partial [Escherichia coli]